jgi:F-type H+-transporting ATPase subunit alpha
MPVSHQVVIIYAAGQGYLDDLADEQVRDFERYLLEYVNTHHTSLMERLERGDWSRRVRTALPEAIEGCRKAFTVRQAEE